MKDEKKLTEQVKLITLMKKIGVMRPRDLKHYSISRQAVHRLDKAGVIERVGRGLYRLAGAEITEHNTITDSAKAVPKGVICLLSALSFHSLTTQSPYEVWMAISVKAHLPRKELPIKFVRFSGKALSMGVENHTIDGVEVKVYSPAKTVADCLKYRNKIGLDVALEVLHEFRKSGNAKMDELWHFAKICRVSNVIRPYMEAITIENG